MCYDFAFSYASEDRETVKKIANNLKKKNYTVFYDLDYQHKLIGQDLYRFLRDMYRNKGKFVVCFLSEHYKQKIWTNLEMTAIKERLIDTFFANDFLIPVWLDSSIHTDIPSFWGYYKFRNIHETVDLLDKKFRTSLHEDIFFENVTKFIEYLCAQITQHLKTKNVNAYLESTQCVCIAHAEGIKRLHILCDNVCYTPCVMIRYEDNYPGNSLRLPDFLLTWDRKKQLLFTVYRFDSYESNFVCHLSFIDLIKFLIQNCYDFR